MAFAQIFKKLFRFKLATGSTNTPLLKIGLKLYLTWLKNPTFEGYECLVWTAPQIISALPSKQAK